MFSIDDYHYILPEDLIAQQPEVQRDRSRLLRMDRSGAQLAHFNFEALDRLLMPSDVLVLNNTKVIPGRLLGHKESGGQAEFLILDYATAAVAEDLPRERVYRCLVKTSKPPRAGAKFRFEGGLAAEIVDGRAGIYTTRFHCRTDFETALHQIGRMPLPPYIKRNGRHDNDRHSYQTIYARHPGAIAAPTAGLHFTADLMERLKTKGVAIVYITLHVGYGTFLPVRTADIRQHTMHAEWYTVSDAATACINDAKKAGRRIIAVGTTSVRTLEYLAASDGMLVAGSGACDLFIYPGYRFKVIDGMITNFHLPKSTLLMLVAAFAGRDEILHAYQVAIKERYRFYSYGDAMLIL
jgi:S-adenosylmethionine:tRNA ribosyltransferase-isomerase